MTDQAKTIGDALDYLNKHIDDIEVALDNEKAVIKKASHRAEILDYMLINARMTRTNMIQELNKIMN